jgi:hypothetical protein
MRLAEQNQLAFAGLWTGQQPILFSDTGDIGLTKQKLATPCGTMIFPSSTPPGLHTLTPSQQPEYTLPCKSHLIPSGIPVYKATRKWVSATWIINQISGRILTSAMANTRRLLRK